MQAIRVLRYATAAAIIFFFCAPQAFGAVAEQLAVCTRSISLGNAVTAHPPGIFSLHYNPAGLTQIKGKELEVGAMVPSFGVTQHWEKPPNYVSFFGQGNDPVAGDSSTSMGMAANLPFNGPASNILAAPYSGMAYHPAGKKWTVGFAIYSPMAVGLENPSGPAVYGAQMLYLQRMVLSPGVGYKLTDTLSVGVSMGLGFGAMGVRMQMRAPNDLVALTGLLGDITRDLDSSLTLGLIPFPLFGGGMYAFDDMGRMTADNLQDNFSPSYNVGILWEPKEWFAAGLCYQSEAKMHLSGHFQLEYSEKFQKMMDWMVANDFIRIFTEALDLPTEGGLVEQSGRASVDFTMPRHVQGGIMVRPFKRLKLMCDAQWTQWSIYKCDVFQFDQDIQMLKLAKLLGYPHGNRTIVFERFMKDTVHLSYGMEFDATKWLKIRLGYEDRPTSVREEYRDAMMVLPDMKIISGGIGVYVSRNADIDVAVGLIKGEDIAMRYEEGAISSNMNTREMTALIYNPYANLNYYQETSGIFVSVGLRYHW